MRHGPLAIIRWMDQFWGRFFERPCRIEGGGLGDMTEVANLPCVCSSELFDARPEGQFGCDHSIITLWLRHISSDEFLPRAKVRLFALFQQMVLRSDAHLSCCQGRHVTSSDFLTCTFWRRAECFSWRRRVWLMQHCPCRSFNNHPSLEMDWPHAHFACP